jgi:hypothetical protein
MQIIDNQCFTFEYFLFLCFLSKYQISIFNENPSKRSECLEGFNTLKILRGYQLSNSFTANQANKPIDNSKLDSSILKVSVCKPLVMPFSLLPVPKR